MPAMPAEFNNILEDKTFTNGAEKDVVRTKYAETFKTGVTHAKELDFSDSGWNAEPKDKIVE